MKFPITNFFLLSILIAVSVSLAACDSTTDPVSNSSAESLYLANTIGGIDVYDLSDSEAAALIFMREEEKLARDVYIKFHELYGLRIFSNIKKSEQAHMDAIKYLLDSYELEDPVGDNEIGVFENEELQDLYNTLIAQGNESVIAALEVGGIIEEVDIIDLLIYLEQVDDNLDIIRVYTNLEKASEQHLRAFVRNLSARGITYEPHYLDQETFDRIINP